MAEPAAPFTGVAAAWQPNGNQADIFYVGESDNQIYNWYWNGSTWSSNVLGNGQQVAMPESGHAGMSATWLPNATHPDLL